MIATLDSPYGVEAKSAYVDTLNDSEVTHRDDYLTAGFAGRIVVAHAFLAADYSVMTYKAIHRRTDQVAAAAGYVYTHDALELRIGGGALLDGRAGGSGLQKWWHERMNDGQVRGRYGRSRVEPLLVAEAAWHADIVPVLDVAASPYSLDVVPQVKIGDEVGALAAGWAWHEDRLSRVSRRVAESMSGPFLRFGMYIGMPDAGAGVAIELSGRTTLAALGFAW